MVWLAHGLLGLLESVIIEAAGLARTWGFLVVLAHVYLKLTERDKRVLRVVERGMARYEYVPLEYIEAFARLPSTHVEMVVRKLNKLGLLRRRVGFVLGYRLTRLGLDMLALDALVRKGVLKALGEKLGVGKESDIYLGYTPAGRKVAVKFHRAGRTSFQRIARTRVYGVGRPGLGWLEYSKIAGEREYRVLDELYREGARVPRPYGYNRHVVVMEYVEGVELYRCRVVNDPLGLLAGILNTLRIAYTKVGVIHGDLSEYNVIVAWRDGGEEPYVIDWPQYVERDYPGSDQFLARDVEYIVRYFAKRFNVSINARLAMDYVRGRVDKL